MLVGNALNLHPAARYLGDHLRLPIPYPLLQQKLALLKLGHLQRRTIFGRFRKRAETRRLSPEFLVSSEVRITARVIMIHYLQGSRPGKKLLDKGLGPCGNEHG